MKGNKQKGSMKPMTTAQHNKYKKAVKDGVITQKQHNSLSPALLDAIMKKKKKKKKNQNYKIIIFFKV